MPGFERPGLQAVACGELGVRALGPAVGRLHRPEQLLLQPLGRGLIELFVGLAQPASASASASAACASVSSSWLRASAVVYATALQVSAPAAEVRAGRRPRARLRGRRPLRHAPSGPQRQSSR